MPAKGYALFTAIPFAGHINPLVRQAAELVRRGWEVSVASVEEGRARVEGAADGVEFLSLGGAETTRSLFDEMQKAADAKSFLGSSLQTMYCINRLWPVMYDGLCNTIRQRKPQVMVVDLVTTAGLDAAADIPMIVNNPDLLVMLPLEILAYEPRLPLAFLDKSIHAVPRWRVPAARAISFIASQIVRRTWVRDLNAFRASRGLQQADWADLLRGKTILNNSAFGLEYQRPLPSRLRMVGPMIRHESDPLPADYESWINHAGQCVYVNMGTICHLSREQLQRILAALACQDFRALWILRDEQRELLGKTIPDTIRIEPWGPPPLSILGHRNVKAFVSHCGVNSVHEAMHSGTPIVGIPMFADQRDMAVRVQDAGAGLILNKHRFTAQELRRCILRVIDDDRFRQSIIPIQESFREAGGIGRAADIIESVS